MLRQTFLLAAGLCTVAVIGAPTLEAAEHIPAYITKAVEDPGRPAEDRQRDADRKPAETLKFAGIKPGDRVMELIPSKGYFTRLFSKVVGPKGHVYAISPPRRPNAPADAPDPVAATKAIAAEPGYSNITAETRPIESLATGDSGPVDVVWTSQNYHDFHNVPNLDVGALNKAIFNALKPGGLYVVLDHAAASGSGARDTSTLHRIDPAIVKTEVLAAGFDLAGESKVLQNPKDDHTLKVFDPSIRGKTDQFILKFRKPTK